VKKRGGEFGDKKKGEILNYGHEKERAWQVMDSHRQVFIFWTDCIVFMEKKKESFQDFALLFSPLFTLWHRYLCSDFLFLYLGFCFSISAFIVVFDFIFAWIFGSRDVILVYVGSVCFSRFYVWCKNWDSLMFQNLTISGFRFFLLSIVQWYI
jgi:hypothetical protein